MIINKTIYAIVVTYNGVEWIDKCFGSLVNSSIPIKILAIDNASSDGTPFIIREKFPEVEVIETGSNLGFGKANNIGLKRVLDENVNYAFLLNQDAWVERNTIENLLEVFNNSGNDFGIISPVPYNGSGDDYDYLYKKYYQLEIKKNNTYYNNTYELPFINAAAWFISLETLSNIGYFHKQFHMHGEDNNYIHRVIKSEKKIGISLSAKYFHDRAKREEKENNSDKRFYAKKVAIKSSLFNPNIDLFRTFIINFKELAFNIHFSFFTTIKLLIYNFYYLFSAINNRSIYQSK